MKKYDRVTTGLKGLDKIIDDLRAGDNVVWQVDEIDDYKGYVYPYVKAAKSDGRKVVYIRFGNHPALFEKGNGVIIHELDASTGFETFSLQLHKVIEKEGRETFYVFDCLSDLLSAWATDLMIGNFFLITCPYLFDMDTLAYFAILRNSHSFKTIARIRETTQVLLEIYKFNGSSCIHPLKAAGRYSPTMFLPHVIKGEEFVPIINSSEAADLFLHMSKKGLGLARRNLDYWDRLFMDVEDLLAQNSPPKRARAMVDQVSRLLIGREERILSLAKKYLTLADLLRIKERMIGSGFVGGKTVGMLLAGSIMKTENPQWGNRLEQHDSFYIGSDIFYSYIVQNGLWKMFMRQRTKEEYFSMAAQLRENILKGIFPEEIKEQFQIMLEYYGQSPIIVRSSSLLEDAFGNAFAGKYESIFCPNQGSPEMRYEYFEQAVRRIYASSMNESALVYRLQHGLDQKDELMSLLVQRVSGCSRKHFFFPEIAGVGFSRNPFTWTQELDPEAGMLRLVFGLGTRAVGRDVGDYPRIVALDNPLLKPHAGIDDTKKYSQHEVDVINIEKNKFETVDLNDLIKEGIDSRLELLGTRDLSDYGSYGGNGTSWILTFDELMTNTEIVPLMSDMLKTLEKAYRYPVDTEFTVNFSTEGKLIINLLQCRPLQTKGRPKRVKIPAVDKARVFLRQKGNFMGGSISQQVRKIIYVDPEKYAELHRTDRYGVARLIGNLNRKIADRSENPVFLLGPGRWGSSSPFLGVPVTFAEISRISILGEIANKQKGMEPDLSFGTHFFQDLVENDIYYIAIFPEMPNVVFSPELPARYEELSELIEPRYQPIVKIYNVPDMTLMADILSKNLVCFEGAETKKRSD
jgi:hypothetical protein